MGWWKVQGTQNVLGDLPLDTLSTAVREVVSLYERAFDRRPTRAEWEVLLQAALDGGQTEVQLVEGGVRGVRLEPSISLPTDRDLPQ